MDLIMDLLGTVVGCFYAFIREDKTPPPIKFL
jgi:hypothetical protein